MKPASLERVRFLVVEDNGHMTNIVKTILRGFGAVHIFEARDATEAFHRLKHDAIDIVIVDYQMEVLNGIEFVNLVRKSSDSANRFVPIIMLTAHSERSHVVDARDAGVTEFCCKPVTANELYRKVVSIVDHPRPFVKLNSFFGPERRRRTDAKYEGPERRKERRPEPSGPESDQDALNAAS
ncbi:response regulator [Asticcacaulis sp.]|uniref:response regulator n=1 Tax=Asticcacaulis sp. TaxID=1872648 RepID=UPI003F7BFB91